MFRKVGTPVLGVVENQSYYTCPSCGDRAHVFGHGGAAKVADELGVALLGEARWLCLYAALAVIPMRLQVPLDIAIREQGDAGKPIVVSSPDSPQARALFGVADGVWAVLEKQGAHTS